MNSKQPSQATNPLSPHYFQPLPHQDDIIDLKELFSVLWQGKWVITALTVIFSFLAITYVLLAKEQWSSTAKIMQPQPSNYAALQAQVAKFQPIFYGSRDELEGFNDPNALYQLFLDEFNSSINKKAFLESSSVFQQEKMLLDNPDDEDELRQLYVDWYQKLSAQAEDVKKSNVSYFISANAETSQQSFQLLNSYIQFIDSQVHKNILNNLKTILNSKQSELEQRASMLIDQATQRLLVEKARSEHALKIAESAGIIKPLQNFDEKGDAFAINLGSDALKAKIEVLSNIKNLAVIKPQLEEVNSKLNQIKSLKVNDKIEFTTYRFLAQPERGISRDKPKRALIVILGFLLGAMIGVGIVLLKNMFLKSQGRQELRTDELV